jgi:hypothetical protein
MWILYLKQILLMRKKKKKKKEAVRAMASSVSSPPPVIEIYFLFGNDSTPRKHHDILSFSPALREKGNHCPSLLCLLASPPLFLLEVYPLEDSPHYHPPLLGVDDTSLSPLLLRFP